ncbi:MAG: NAD-dependent epimerase/dehydratase family protein [Sumerlaeia bacterium]
MRVAIFGGTGFMGYDFVRLLLDEGTHEPVVYCTSPKNLTNLRRHPVAVRFVPPHLMANENLDEDIDLIVNFAHPFQQRDQMTPNQQTDLFVRFLEKARARNPKLRMVHISTLSVYEPFSEDKEYAETDPLDPPGSDLYATTKLYAEKAIRGIAGAEEWQVVLRPTIVYGSFCRPWTDGLLKAFAEGDVGYCDLGGMIQPITGRDISRFIRRVMDDFKPGVYNMAGQEKVSWKEFFTLFQEVVGEGRLVQVEPPPPGAVPVQLDGLAFYRFHAKELQRVIVANRSFNAIATRMAKPVPRTLVMKVRRSLGLDKPPAPRRAGAAAAGTDVQLQFTKPFFGEDRLVSRAHFEDTFPDFATTPLGQMKETLREYYEYRFTDKIYT